MTDHLSDQEFVSYVHHTPTDVRQEIMDAHLATCPHCRASLSDHEAMRQHIQRSIQADMRAAQPSSQMTFAAIAPRLRHPGKSVWVQKQVGQLVPSATALAVLIALAIVLFALLGSISRPSGSTSSAVIPQPPSMAIGAVFTASIAVSDSGQLHLMGYDLSSARLTPGAMLTVTLYWQAQRKTANDYVVFVHLLDKSSRPVSGSDAAPADGTRPTSDWTPGERVTDPHTLALPGDLAPGDYQLAVGLYNLDTGVRLADPVLLDRPITIAP